jgi:RimJ/RimL family protein N-acetyltransferase
MASVNFVDHVLTEEHPYNTVRLVNGLTARRLVDYLFDVHRATQGILDARVDNSRAIRSYLECGFQALGWLLTHELHEGRWLDCLRMGIAPPL